MIQFGPKVTNNSTRVLWVRIPRRREFVNFARSLGGLGKRAARQAGATVCEVFNRLGAGVSSLVRLARENPDEFAEAPQCTEEEGHGHAAAPPAEAALPRGGSTEVCSEVGFDCALLGGRRGVNTCSYEPP